MLGYLHWFPPSNSLNMLPEVIKAQPDLVIVGGITGQADKNATAAEMKRLVRQA